MQSPPVLDLSGLWNAAISTDVKPYGEQYRYPTHVPHTSDLSTSVTVPGECALQNMQIDESSTVLMRTRVVIPDDWRGHTIMLRLDCVHAASAVWCNGIKVGEDEGVFLPTAYDLTSACTIGEANELVIASTATSTAEEIAKASRYGDHPLTGILRQVRLFRLPAVFPAGLIVRSRFSNSGSATVEISGLLLYGTTAGDSPPAVAVNAMLLDRNHQLVSECRRAITSENGDRLTLAFHVEHPQAWSPEQPDCYTLQLHVGDGTHTARYERRIGLRSIEVTGTTVCLNGSPIKLRGVCRHDAHPTAGRAYVPGLCETDVALFQEANVNFLRTSHYPPNEELVDATDAAGVFVEVEAPVCWAFGFAPYDESERRSVLWSDLSPQDQKLRHESVVTSCLRMARLYGDHPSVIIWSLANESLWAPPFEAAARALDEIDPGRLRTFNWADYAEDDAEFCQIGVHHYPGPEGLAQYATSSRPILFDEYCHINCYNRSELKTDPGLRDLWWQAISTAWDTILRTPAYLGGSVWSGVDECFSKQDGKLIGYGYWGVISGDRRRKPEHYHLRKAYSPVRLLIRTARVDPEQRYLTVPFETQLASETLSAYEIHWRCGNDSGVVPMHEAVGTNRRELMIALPPTNFTAGVPVFLDVRSLRGQVIDEEVFITDRGQLDTEASVAGLQSGSFPVESCEPFAIPRHLLKEPLKLTDYTATVLENQAGRFCADGSCSWSRSETGSGGVTLTYRWTVREGFDPWQAGVVLRLRNPVVRLEWARDGEHSCYPQYHAGRNQGAVSLSEHDSPDWVATKRNLTEVRIETSDGQCFHLKPSGAAHLRVLRDRSEILLLAVAAAGSESFVESYYGVYTLEPGDVVSGAWTISSSHHSEQRGR